MSVEALGAPPVDDGAYPAISETVYHADWGSFSQSGAKSILKSPARFHWERTHPKVQKKAYDLGHYVHGKALGVGEPVVVIDAADYRTKKAQETRDAAYAEDKVPILAKTAVVGDAMAAKLLDHPIAGSLLANDDRSVELSTYWHDVATGIRLRARFDVLAPVGDWLVVGDVKTTDNSTDPVDFGRIAANLGYYIQNAWYSEGASTIDPQRRVDFINLVVEVDPPHLVSIVRLPERARELGRQKMRRAIDLYAQCTANDHWPDWPDPSSNLICQSDLPAWFYFQEEE